MKVPVANAELLGCSLGHLANLRPVFGPPSNNARHERTAHLASNEKIVPILRVAAVSGSPVTTLAILSGVGLHLTVFLRGTAPNFLVTLKDTSPCDVNNKLCVFRYIYTDTLADLDVVTAGSEDNAGGPDDVRVDPSDPSSSSAAGDSGAAEPCALQPCAKDNQLMELLVAADKYLLPGLRVLCQQRLAASLDVSLDASPSVLKLCNLLRAAHLLDSAPLRLVGLQYLRANKDRVLRDEQWKQFAAANHGLAAAAFYDAVTSE